MVPSPHPAGGLTVSTHHTGSRVVVTLAGRLDLDAVEDLAACADRICQGAVQAGARGGGRAVGRRDAVRVVSFDVGAVVSADEAGVRTLAAACRCLAWHGLAAEVRGLGGAVREISGRLGLRLPDAVPVMQAPVIKPAVAAPVGR